MSLLRGEKTTKNRKGHCREGGTDWVPPRTLRGRQRGVGGLYSSCRAGLKLEKEREKESKSLKNPPLSPDSADVLNEKKKG